MFGYVKAKREELTIRQDSFYRAAYCGLCKEMGRCTGQCSRLTLSYDMVFLYFVRAALLGIKPEIKKGRCLLHPLRKKNIVRSDSELKYAAEVSALLAYGKVCDDIADKKGILKLPSIALKPFVLKAKQRAGLASLYSVIEEKLGRLSKIEKSGQASVDAPANAFGELLAEVFAYGLDGGNERIAREIGFRTGRWIYAVDAADDIEEDKKSGSYNPFLLLYGGEIDNGQKDIIEMAMKYDLSALAAAVDLIDECDMLNIVKNIIYLGMPEALCKGEKSEQKSI